MSDTEKAPGTDHQGRQMFLSNGGECVFRSKQPYRNKKNCLERNASVYGVLSDPGYGCPRVGQNNVEE